MKTKEEILKEVTKRTLNINEGSPLHDAVMKAMEEYAQQQVKNYSMPNVVEQSEQLIGKEKETTFDLWLKKFNTFKHAVGDLYWYDEYTLYGVEGMRYIYNTEVKK